MGRNFADFDDGSNYVKRQADRITEAREAGAKIDGTTKIYPPVDVSAKDKK